MQCAGGRTHEPNHTLAVVSRCFLSVAAGAFGFRPAFRRSAALGGQVGRHDKHHHDDDDDDDDWWEASRP